MISILKSTFYLKSIAARSPHSSLISLLYLFMKQILSLLIIYYFFFLDSPFLLAQAAILPSGGDVAGISGTIAFSIGQIADSVIDSSEISLIEGVQQPYELFIFSNIENVIPGIMVKLYPNPSSDILSLQIANVHLFSLRYVLYSLEGEMIRSGRAVSNITQIDVKDLPGATYVLSIYNKFNKSMSYKIIKTN